MSLIPRETQGFYCFRENRFPYIDRAGQASWNYSNFICTLARSFPGNFLHRRLRPVRTTHDVYALFSVTYRNVLYGCRSLVYPVSRFFLSSVETTHLDPVVAGPNPFDRWRTRKTRSTCRPRERFREILWLFRDSSTGLDWSLPRLVSVETIFTRRRIRISMFSLLKILLTLPPATRDFHLTVASDKNLFDSELNDVWRKVLLVNASCENEKRPVGSRLTGPTFVFTFVI